jgi:hypothetical protein
MPTSLEPVREGVRSVPSPSSAALAGLDQMKMRWFPSAACGLEADYVPDPPDTHAGFAERFVCAITNPSV